ncbi:MAG TPA: DUF4192 domain-containing protein [Trebonia sp.]|jgi:hypothetical protein|nr:DUF4192 domain-containing protein [Trebonia sp.]
MGRSEPRSGPPARQRRRLTTATWRAVRAAIMAYRQGGIITDHDQLAWLACALTDTTVRDAAWHRMTPARNAAHQRLWTTLARAAPGRLAAAPAALLAFCAWQNGDDALARIAVQRAEDSQPGYSLAATMRQAISAATGLPPDEHRALIADAFKAVTDISPDAARGPSR